MTDKLLQPEQELESSNNLLNDILTKIRETTTQAMTLPANISAMGSSGRDLSLLINAQKKKEILAVLHDVELGEKVHLLSKIHDVQNDNAFDKKELPYISRFTVYSILEELFAQSWTIFQNQKELNKLSNLDIVDNMIESMKLDHTDVILLRELINKNETHYLKHFGEEYTAKLKLVKKVLKNYTK